MCLLRKIVLILSDVIILRSRLSDSIRHDWSVIAQFPSIGIHDDKQTVFYCILIFIERDETRLDGTRSFPESETASMISKDASKKICHDFATNEFFSAYVTFCRMTLYQGTIVQIPMADILMRDAISL